MAGGRTNIPSGIGGDLVFPHQLYPVYENVKTGDIDQRKAVWNGGEGYTYIDDDMIIRIIFSSANRCEIYKCDLSFNVVATVTFTHSVGMMTLGNESKFTQAPIVDMGDHVLFMTNYVDTGLFNKFPFLKIMKSNLATSVAYTFTAVTTAYQGRGYGVCTDRENNLVIYTHGNSSGNIDVYRIDSKTGAVINGALTIPTSQVSSNNNRNGNNLVLGEDNNFYLCISTFDSSYASYICIIPYNLASVNKITFSNKPLISGCITDLATNTIVYCVDGTLTKAYLSNLSSVISTMSFTNEYQITHFKKLKDMYIVSRIGSYSNVGNTTERDMHLAINNNFVSAIIISDSTVNQYNSTVFPNVATLLEYGDVMGASVNYSSKYWYLLSRSKLDANSSIMKTDIARVSKYDFKEVTTTLSLLSHAVYYTCVSDTILFNANDSNYLVVRRDNGNTIVPQTGFSWSVSSISITGTTQVVFAKIGNKVFITSSGRLEIKYLVDNGDYTVSTLSNFKTFASNMFIINMKEYKGFLYVTCKDTSSNYNVILHKLNPSTGATEWSVNLSTLYGFANSNTSYHTDEFDIVNDTIYLLKNIVVMLRVSDGSLVKTIPQTMYNLTATRMCVMNDIILFCEGNLSNPTYYTINTITGIANTCSWYSHSNGSCVKMTSNHKGNYCMLNINLTKYSGVYTLYEHPIVKDLFCLVPETMYTLGVGRNIGAMTFVTYTPEDNIATVYNKAYTEIKALPFSNYQVLKGYEVK